MPTRAAMERLYLALLDKHGQAIADAFFAAIDDLKSAAEVQRVITALEAGDIQAAIDALHLDAAAYDRMLDAVAQAYADGGENAVTQLPKRAPDGTALIIRFHARNRRAEEQLRQTGAELVTRVLDDQRTAIRNHLIAGMERGENPRTTALSIVGRVNRASGKRVGGVLGLTDAQAGFVRSARLELSSGDPAAIANYFSRTRRDKRFDRTIARAMRDGEPVPAETIGKALVAYERRLLQLRGETIGRKEAMTALQAAKFEAHIQAVEQGAIPENAIRRTWRDSGLPNVRHTHTRLDGQTVGLREPFVSVSGARLMYPGDPAAPASEIIGCRCDVQYRVDWFANVR